MLWGWLLAVVGLLHGVASAQTAVYVKFLSPPHGYTHNLHVATRGGLAVSKEERIYPGDSRHPRFQQDWYQQSPSQPYSPKLYHPPPPSNHYQPPTKYLAPPQSQFYQAPQSQYHPPPQSQYHPPPRSQYHPPPQSQYHPPAHGQYLPPAQKPYTQPNYFYTRPSKPFDEYGLPPQQYQNDRPSEEETYNTGSGEYYNPAYSPHQKEVSYDPLLITGPQAAQYVAFLFSRGELFFHLIPHERLVLMNQEDRIQNNLHPHVLASIRPNHPFFLHR